MIKRIPQRTQNDCVICVLAMVMGPPYSYERVLQDSLKYTKKNPDGTFPAWWQTYLRDEGFLIDYFSSTQLSILSGLPGTVVGILGMNIPHLNSAHAVVVDEIGVVDPATNAPDHIPLQQYLRNRVQDGVVFHDIWLGIKKS
jgi:hypothetical protein